MTSRPPVTPDEKLIKKYGQEWPLERYYEADTDTYPLGSRIFAAIAVGLFWLIGKIWTRWSVEGKENLDEIPADKGVIFVANHGTLADPIFLQCSNLRGRRLRFLYKSEYDDSKFLRFVFSRVGAFPVDRGTADRKALKRCAKALERGEDVCIFPEGTRVRGRFSRGEAHGGFALIAHMANAPIVPVAIEGAWRLPKPIKVHLKVGKPIYLTDFEGLDRRERIAVLEQVAMDEVFKMREELDSRNRDYPKDERNGYQKELTQGNTPKKLDVAEKENTTES